VQKCVESSLGMSLEEAFGSFERAPLATASIAQTHRATTRDGAPLVVKVQRPGIESVMRGDLDLLMLLAQVLEASVDEVQLIGVVDIVAEFQRALLTELDFGNELKNLLRMRSLLDPEGGVSVPRPYPELSSQHVLSMSYFPGKSVRTLVPKAPATKAVVAALVRAMAKHVLIDGFFHGDPHAGNLLVDDAGELALIDLGLVGTLSKEQREDIVTLVVAVIANDTSSVARTLLRMGTPTERVQLEELRAEITRMRSRYLTLDVGALDTSGFAEEFAVAANRFRVKLASEFALLVKSIATVEGVVRTLDPDVDLMGTIGPYVRQVVSGRFSPHTLLSQLGGEASSVGSMLWRLPAQLDQLFHDFETGHLQLRAVTPELDTLPALVHQAGSRISLALFATAMAVCAALTLTGEPPPTYRVLLCVALSVLSAGAWLILVVWHVVGRGKPLRLGPLLRALRAK